MSRTARFSDRTLFLLLALGTFALDAAGFGLQTWLRLSPCPLCIFQRFLFLVLAALALCGALLPWQAPRRGLGWLILLVSLFGAGVAGYQSWMQAFPDDFTISCNYTDPNLIEQFVDWLGNLQPDLFMASGLCTSKSWSLFGLSMANWSLGVFGLIAGVSILRLRKR